MNKKTSQKRVFLNSIIYTFGGLLQKCLSFFLLPLYTIYLTTEDYGINSVASSFLTTMGFIVAFSLFSAIMRFYVDLKDDPEKLKRFYGSIISFVFLSSICFFIVLTIFRDIISKYIFSGIDYFPIIFICILSLVFHCQSMIYSNILRSQQKALKSSIISIIYFFLSIALNIMFVVGFKMGATGTLTASLICNIIHTIHFLVDICIHKEVHFCLDWSLLKEALKYSIPIMPHNLSTQIAVLVSKMLIGGANSLGALGVYSVASQFGNMSDTIQGYADSAYGPWLYEKLKAKEDQYKQTIRKTSNLILSGIGLFFIGIALFAQDYILLFVDKSYADAWRYVPLIVSVFAIKSAYYFYVEVLFYYKKASRKLFVATLTSSLVNIGFSAVFIPFWGVYGSILADAISMLLRVAIIIFISKRYDDIGLRIRDFVVNFFVIELFIFGGLLLSYLKFEDSFSFVNFLYKIAVILVYIFVMYLRYRREINSFFVSFKKRRLNKE